MSPYSHLYEALHLTRHLGVICMGVFLKTTFKCEKMPSEAFRPQCCERADIYLSGHM